MPEHFDPTSVPEALRPHVEALLSRGNWIRSSDAASALGASGNTAAVPALCAAVSLPTGIEKDIEMTCRTGYWSVREEAARALGELGDARAVEPLCVLLKDWAPVSARAAAWALGKLGDARAIEPLCHALESRDNELQATAATVLGRFRNAAAVDALIANAMNPNAERVSAIRALAVIGDKRAVSPLCELLCQVGPHGWGTLVRQNAAWSLGELGCPEVLSLLRQRARFFGGDPDGEVRSWIRSAIKKIKSASRNGGAGAWQSTP